MEFSQRQFNCVTRARTQLLDFYDKLISCYQHKLVLVAAIRPIAYRNFPLLYTLIYESDTLE